MSDTKKAAFAAAASQLFNDTKGGFGSKSFNINISAAPATTTTTGTTNTTATTKSVGFVFGSGLASRVVSAKPKEDVVPTSNNVSDIFSAFAKKNESDFISACKDSPDASTSADWLNDAKAGDEKGKSDDTVVEKPKTGEENEKNILNIASKIFQYDVESKSWKERGPCNLRLNETDESDADGNPKARLVARSSGTQKVLLNSLIFPEMVFESVSEKRIKISAHVPDTDLPQLFLVSSTPSNIGQLSAQLRKRIKEDVKPVGTPTANRKRKVESEARESAEDGAAGDKADADSPNGSSKRAATSDSP
uniref:RanBD1 domain-containing protein n=1 Tax=Panagrellus redivivus TaxID=6233 RepID=A0A7E4VAS6_PANRE